MGRATRFRRPLAWVILPLVLLLIGTVSSLAAPAASSTEPFVQFQGDMPPGPGSYATVVRNHEGLHVNAHANGLEPGAYTMWVVVRNDGPIDPAGCKWWDLIGFGGGHIVGKSGKGNFGGHLKVGDSSGAIRGAQVPRTSGPGDDSGSDRNLRRRMQQRTDVPQNGRRYHRQPRAFRVLRPHALSPCTVLGR